MNQEITKDLADGAVTLAVGGGIVNKLGWFAFINANAPGLGFIASCVFGIIATVFYYLSHRAKNKNTIEIAALKKALANKLNKQ